MSKFKFIILLLAICILPLNVFSAPQDRAKIELVINIPQTRPHAPLRFQAYVEEVNGVLQLSFLGNFSDVNISITDADGSEVYQETNGTIYDGKVIYITPADGYPYDVTITSSSINIIGVIYLE